MWVMCVSDFLSPIMYRMQEFTIFACALSVNTMYRTFQGRILISKPGRRYKQQVTQALKDQRQAKQYQTITEPCAVDIQLRFKSRRKRDVDNALKPLLDCLQDAAEVCYFVLYAIIWLLL